METSTFPLADDLPDDLEAVLGSEHVDQLSDSAESKPLHRKILDCLRSGRRSYRQCCAPSGVDIDEADALLKAHEAEVQEWQQAHPGSPLLHGTSNMFADRLMESLEEWMPKLAHDPIVRAYFLDRAGYLSGCN
ncbi:hypothetical protein FJZ27_03005 [Candidatus Peribacteria bacterium]|nr:hypothetical protein [Candidatus Peribacteria bacterium]